MGSTPSKPKDTKLQTFREPTGRQNLPEKSNLDGKSDGGADDLNDDDTGENPNIDDELRRLGTPCSTINMNFKRAAYGGVYNVKLYRNDESECRIRGAEFLPNGNLLLCDQNNCNVKLFSEKFQYLNHLKFPAKPFDLCIHSTDLEGSDVYVTLPSLRKIVHLGVEEKDIVVGDSILTDGWCYGISPYSGGLVVCVGSKVEIMDTAGVVIKSVQYDSEGATMFGSPFYVSVTPYDELLISDTVKMCVVCVNWVGEEIFRYDMADSPHGVACNKDGSVFVCAGTDRQTSDVVHQLLADGSAVTIMLHWRHVGFVPDCVCYRPSDKLLLLAGQNNRIKTFKTDTKKTWKRNAGSRASTSIVNRNGTTRPGSNTDRDIDTPRMNMTIQEFQSGTKPPGYESRKESRNRERNVLTLKSKSDAKHGHDTQLPDRNTPENLREESHVETRINMHARPYVYETIMEEDAEEDENMETETSRSPPPERIKRQYTHKVRKNHQRPGTTTTENMRYTPGFPALTETPFPESNDLKREESTHLAEVLALRDNANLQDPPNKFVAIGSWKSYSGWKLDMPDPYE